MACGCLTVAELALFLGIEGCQKIAQNWIEQFDPIPLADREISARNNPKPYELQYRYGRIKFMLHHALKPTDLLRKSEHFTQFAKFEEEDSKQAKRQLGFVVLHLAHLWAHGQKGYRLMPAAFLYETRWILDLIESGWSSQSPSFRLEVFGARSDIARYIVYCSAKHGHEVLAAIRNEFDSRWASQDEAWWTGLQRDIIMAFIQLGGVQHRWAKEHLQRIESIMLRDLELYGRVEECEKQVKAWLAINECEAGLSTLRSLVQTSRGIYHDEDYQLARWAYWLRKTNALDPRPSKERIRALLRRILSGEGNTSNVSAAAEVMLQVTFDWSPRRAIRLFKALLERQTITHQDGLTHLLTAALESQNPPILELCHTVINLLLPFARASKPDLVKELIIRTNALFGHDAAIQTAQKIVHSIRIDALANQRRSWFRGVNNGLQVINVTPQQVGLQLLDFEEPSEDSEESSSSLDKYLYLKNGEKLKLEEVQRSVQTIDDLRHLLKVEDRERTNYFEWNKVAEHLAAIMPSTTELWELHDLVLAQFKNSLSSERDRGDRGELLIALSKRFEELGDWKSVQELAERVIALTKPSGWAKRFDGGVKYAVMQRLVSALGAEVRPRLIKLYAQDLSERFRYPESVVLYLHEVAEILCDEIPYAELWPAIEVYLDELFAGIYVYPQIVVEDSLDIVIDESVSDTPEHAIADLLMLYLDFPSYSVANGAIRACTSALLEDSAAIKLGLKQTLTQHDQVTEHALMVLEAVSLQTPQVVRPYEDILKKLQASPNIIIRSIATRVYGYMLGAPPILPLVEREMPGIYQIHLPNITIHKTEQSVQNETNPILLDDPALGLRPLDIEARALAQATSLPEDNVLYRTAQKYLELQPMRTWLADTPQLEPTRLSRFLDQIHLRLSYNKPNISPARHAIAHVAAEIYDAGYLPQSNLPLLNTIFRNYDLHFFLRHAAPRPSFVERIGGLDYSDNYYVETPKNWLNTAKDSMSLLSDRADDGRIILGEWTRLKRLERDWPMEERMSLIRAVEASQIWEEINPRTEELPFDCVKGAQVTDYWQLTDLLTSELVIAHNGYTFRTQGAYWLAFNPQVASALGWQPSTEGWFRWIDAQDHVVVESVWWKDSTLDLFSLYDRVEVGSGWLVLITEHGYNQIARWADALSRDGVVRRSLGQFALAGQVNVEGPLTLPQITMGDHD